MPQQLHCLTRQRFSCRTQVILPKTFPGRKRWLLWDPANRLFQLSLKVSILWPLDHSYDSAVLRNLACGAIGYGSGRLLRDYSQLRPSNSSVIGLRMPLLQQMHCCGLWKAVSVSKGVPLRHRADWVGA